MTRKKLLTHENIIAVGRMRYLEGMTYVAIAKRMGLKEEQVHRIAYRAGLPSVRLPLRSVAEMEGLNQDSEPVTTTQRSSDLAQVTDAERPPLELTGA